MDTLQTGGAEKSLLEITSRFHHFQAVFLTIFKGDHSLEEAYQKNGLEVQHLGFPKGTSYKKILPTLRTKVSEIRPLLVHASLFHAEMLSRKLDLGIPILNSLVNNSYHTRRYSQLTWKGKLALLRVQVMDFLSKGNVDLFIANSTYMAKVHEKTLALPSSKIKVIHRGRSIGSYKGRNSAHVQNLRNQLPFPDTKLFLNVGRLIDRKGQMELVDAFARLASKHPNTVLWIAGKGEMEGPLSTKIKALELSSKVMLLGDRSDLPDLLAAADFFVFPSHYEGLPGALIEAMVAKLPIICSDIPENRECVDGEMALFHQVMDGQDLARQMESALKLPDWPQRTEKAYAYACTHFDVEKIAREYEETYLELIGKGEEVISD